MWTRGVLISRARWIRPHKHGLDACAGGVRNMLGGKCQVVSRHACLPHVGCMNRWTYSDPGPHAIVIMQFALTRMGRIPMPNPTMWSAQSTFPHRGAINDVRHRAIITVIKIATLGLQSIGLLPWGFLQTPTVFYKLPHCCTGRVPLPGRLEAKS